MDIQEMRKLKKQTEDTIRNTIVDFQTKTGLEVYEVQVNISEVTSHASQSSEYQIGSVRIKVEL